MIDRECGNCGTPIHIWPSQATAVYNYCNRACYHAHRKHTHKTPRRDLGRKLAPRVVRECPTCGAEIEILASRARHFPRTFCSPEHLALWMKTGGGRPEAPLGSTKPNADGYILEKTALGWKMQHRVVMEQVLGRPLRDDENVHHRNGVKADNRPANLELWVRSQPSGQRVVDVLAWAHEIVRRYDGEAELLRVAEAPPSQ